MKGRDHQGKGPASTDLLVCFPTRAHLTLMPKRICSPSRPTSDINTRHLTRHHTRKCSNLASSGGGHASPLLWAKTNKHKNNNNNNINNNSDDMSSEPTSPKVTCAGQVKVRAKPGCKNWQSVMEEIERIHNKGKKKKRATWMDAIGLKKDVMQFLTCLRHIRFDFRCFGSFPATSDITSDDEDEDDEDEEESTNDENCRNNGDDVFSKWFMILQENNDQGPHDESEGKSTVVDDSDDDGPCAPPPPNALLLMRCRSAPAKSWLEEKEEEEEKEKEKEKGEKKENLVVMKYGADLSKISCDIAKETWVVGGIQNMLSRSRSSKR